MLCQQLDSDSGELDSDMAKSISESMRQMTYESEDEVSEIPVSDVKPKRGRKPATTKVVAPKAKAKPAPKAPVKATAKVAPKKRSGKN